MMIINTIIELYELDKHCYYQCEFLYDDYNHKIVDHSIDEMRYNIYNNL